MNGLVGWHRSDGRAHSLRRLALFLVGPIAAFVESVALPAMWNAMPGGTVKLKIRTCLRVPRRDRVGQVEAGRSVRHHLRFELNDYRVGARNEHTANRAAAVQRTTVVELSGRLLYLLVAWLDNLKIVASAALSRKVYGSLFAASHRQGIHYLQRLEAVQPKNKIKLPACQTKANRSLPNDDQVRFERGLDDPLAMDRSLLPSLEKRRGDVAN